MREQKFDFDVKYHHDEKLKRTPSGNSRTRRRQSRAGIRRIQHPWKHSEILSLIKAVERRPGLWDANSDQYKLPKLNFWREVCHELGMKIDLNEIKLKWASLRVSFKVNMANYRKRMSELGPEETYTVPWRYFQPMLFLEHNGTAHISNFMVKLPSAVTEQSGFDDSIASTEPTTSAAEAEARIKRESVSLTPTPPVSPPISPTQTADSPCSRKPPIKTVDNVDTPDRDSAFCKYLLSELKALPTTKALGLRRALSDTLWNFLDRDNP